MRFQRAWKDNGSCCQHTEHFIWMGCTIWCKRPLCAHVDCGLNIAILVLNFVRTFSGWKSVIRGVKRHRLGMDSIQSMKKNATLSACFRRWQMEYKARTFAVMREHRRARSTLTEVLTAWKMFVAERRCERQEQNEVLQEVFSYCNLS